MDYLLLVSPFEYIYALKIEGFQFLILFFCYSFPHTLKIQFKCSFLIFFFQCVHWGFFIITKLIKHFRIFLQTYKHKNPKITRLENKIQLLFIGKEVICNFKMVIVCLHFEFSIFFINWENNKFDYCITFVIQYSCE